MDGDQKFWLILWTIAGIVSVIGYGLSTDYYKHENEIIAKMIKDGHSPIAAACAFEDEYGKHPTCIIEASKGE